MADSFNSGGVATLTAVQTDGLNIVNVQADPTLHQLSVSDGTTGTDNGPSNSLRDGNHRAALLATSSSDGKTPVVVYADSSGNLLIDSM